jgi:hypothetical protein
MILPDGRLAMIGGTENVSRPDLPMLGDLASGLRAAHLLSPSGSPGGVFGINDWIDSPQYVCCCFTYGFYSYFSRYIDKFCIMLGFFCRSTALIDPRWYPSVITLPDGRLLVLGGSNIGVQFNSDWCNTATYEFLPRTSDVKTSTPLQFMWDSLPANLYPITFVLPSGRVFVFAGNKATLLDPHDDYQSLGIMQFVVGVRNPVGPDVQPFPRPLNPPNPFVNDRQVVAFAGIDESFGAGVQQQAQQQQEQGRRRRDSAADFKTYSCVSATAGGGDDVLLTTSTCDYLDPAHHNLTTAPIPPQGFVLLSPGDNGAAKEQRGVGRIMSMSTGMCFSVADGADGAGIVFEGGAVQVKVIFFLPHVHVLMFCF